MIKPVHGDIELVAQRLSDLRLRVAISVFGSSALGRRPEGSDVDVAVIVDRSEKESVVRVLRRLGSSERRVCNWTIDVFDQDGKNYGYNKRHSGTLHFLVLSDSEYEGDSALARNIREAAVEHD